jgi:hypothetical protein
VPISSACQLPRRESVKTGYHETNCEFARQAGSSGRAGARARIGGERARARRYFFLPLRSKYACSAARASCGPLMCQVGVLTTSALTAISGFSAGA